ncbi:MAG: hypothetical protein JHC33_10675 [Ignisphaera sp.]|jgi:hypothetical protein|nr:hypothetical protein [Ignisphaera sp.]
MAKVKSLQAKKVINKPQDLTHKYFEPDRLVAKWQREGKSSEEIRDGLIKYVTDERQKCFDDPIYFANSYGFIIGHGASGIIPFNADTYQETLLKGVRHDKYSIAVKSRQLGVSTVIMFYCLWFSIFSQGKKTLVVAHKREGAEEFIAKLKTAYEFLPEWLKPPVTLYSKSTVEFDTKSSIKAMTSNPHAARSFSATLFVLDEAAFIENCDEVVKAILPTVAAVDGKLIAISSPNGNSDLNWFYKTYTYAESKLNPWTDYNLPYTVSKIFMANPNFREDQIRVDNGNTDKFEQEWNCNFNVNLASLFSPNVLKAFKPNSDILNKQLGGITYEDTLFIWKLAEVGKKYKIGVDCSSNKASAKDYTAFEVIDEETQEQMAEYIGKLPTELLVEILIKTGKHYNTAELVIEENSYSQLVIYLLEQKNYKNLWYADNKTTPGFNTNRNSRVLLLEKLILFYNNLHGISKLKSARLKVQMENFSAGQVYADGSKKFEASKGNDDAILALALAVVTLTPKEYFHRPELEGGGGTLMMSTENMTATGEYSEEYLEHFSVLMGISKTSLASRLKLYHDIKSGVYEGSGLEDLNFVHPVEEWERAQAAADFLGMANTSILNETEFTNVKKATLPFGEQYAMDDIFSEDLPAIYAAHRNFLTGNKGNVKLW